MLIFESLKQAFRRPTAEAYIRQHLDEARLDLLKWENALRYAEAQVSYHKATIEALEESDESVLSTRAKVQREVVQPVRIKTGTGGRGLVESVELGGQ